MTTFLHEAPPACCHAVLFYAPRRITRLGPRHKLPVICAAPAHQPGSQWCAHHAGERAATDPPSPPPVPRDAHCRSLALPADPAEPDLCTLIKD